MDDRAIIDMFFNREESAISQIQTKYGGYCYKIAFNILRDRCDAEESVNDTYIGVWNSIPPNRPSNLRTYIGKLARRLSVDKLRVRNAQKRGGTEKAVCIDELEECIPDNSSVEKEIENTALAHAVNDYLRTLPDEKRRIFICRYWYCCSQKEICSYFNISRSKASNMLLRIRRGLKEYLEKEDLFYE